MNTENQSQKSDNQKMSFVDFLKLTKWAFSLIYKLEPKYTVIYLVTIILENVRFIVNAYILSSILDILISISQTPGAKISQLYPYLGVMFVVGILFSLIAFLNTYSGGIIRNSSRPRIRTEFYTLLNNLGIQNLEHPEVNNLINRADRFLWNLLPYTVSSMEVVGSIFSLLSAFIVLSTVFPLIAILTAVSTIPYFIFDKKYRGIMYRFDLENTEESRRMGWIASSLSSSKELQEIKITGSFNYLDEKHNSYYNWFVKNIINIMKRWQISVRSFRVTSDFVVLVGYTQIFAQLLTKTMSVGMITFHIRNLSGLQDSLMGVMRRVNDLMESSLQLKEVYQLFHTKPAFPDGKTIMPRVTEGPDIRLTNVSFKYPNSEKTVIKDLSLRIKPGEKVAIVGHNGAGKTTLVKLLIRIYQTTSGEILINGTSVNDFNIDSVYKNTGVIFQDYNNYPELNVRDNIFLIAIKQ